MEKIDLELKLYSDDPIWVDEVPIYPVSIQQIARIGYTAYHSVLRYICLTADEIRVNMKTDIQEENVFYFLCSGCTGNADLCKNIEQMMSILTHENIQFDPKRLSFFCEDFSIDRDNFLEVQKVIQFRNGLHRISEEEENPDNEVTRRLLQRRKEERLKRRKAKSDDSENAITISDLVSIMASSLGMTLHKVMQYDMFQFNDQFNRLKIMDDYDVSVQAILHGAKKEDIEFKHWITKIKCGDE